MELSLNLHSAVLPNKAVLKRSSAVLTFGTDITIHFIRFIFWFDVKASNLWDWIYLLKIPLGHQKFSPIIKLTWADFHPLRGKYFPNLEAISHGFLFSLFYLPFMSLNNIVLLWKYNIFLCACGRSVCVYVVWVASFASFSRVGAVSQSKVCVSLIPGLCVMRPSSV